MNKNLSPFVAALVALALLASACGGDAASASDQEVIDAVATQMRNDDAPEEMDIDCMAAAMVNGMGGAEAMEATYGLTAATIAAGEDPEDVELSKDAAISLADEAMDCGLGDIILTEMMGDGMAESDAKCLIENLDQDAIRDMTATEFMTESDASAVGAAAEEALLGSLLGAVSDCDLDPSSLGF
jgi:hypothetical protein